MANIKDTSILCSGLELVNNIKDINAPNFAESIVAAVLGDTNLLSANRLHNKS